MSSSSHSGHTLDVEAQSPTPSFSMKVEADAIHPHTPQQPQKQEVDEERIHVDEKQQQQQTRLSAFQEKMAPLMLFVVSMAQFIDISKFSIYCFFFLLLFVVAFLFIWGINEVLLEGCSISNCRSSSSTSSYTNSERIVDDGGTGRHLQGPRVR